MSPLSHCGSPSNSPRSWSVRRRGHLGITDHWSAALSSWGSVSQDPGSSDRGGGSPRKSVGTSVSRRPLTDASCLLGGEAKCRYRLVVVGVCFRLVGKAHRSDRVPRLQRLSILVRPPSTTMHDHPTTGFWVLGDQSRPDCPSLHWCTSWQQSVCIADGGGGGYCPRVQTHSCWTELRSSQTPLLSGLTRGVRLSRGLSPPTGPACPEKQSAFWLVGPPAWAYTSHVAAWAAPTAWADKRRLTHA